MQVVYFLCTNNLKNLPVQAYSYLFASCVPGQSILTFVRSSYVFPGCFGSTAKKPSLKLFHGESSGFSPGKIAPGTSSSFSFTFSCFFFQFHIPFCYFEGGLGGVLSLASWSGPGLGHSYLRIFVLTPLKYSTSLSATFVLIHSPLPK